MPQILITIDNINFAVIPLITLKINFFTASSTLSISPRHLREISDPISLLLSQLHKLIYLTQLPPSHKPSARRTLIEQYKRYLFDRASDPSNLKSELHKLSSGVSDIVQILSESEGNRMVECCLDELRELSLGQNIHTTL